MPTNAPLTEADCAVIGRDDLIAINAILNTPGALSALWLIIQERREADATWSKLFSDEETSHDCR